jgi:hypothetical protein
LSVTHHGQRGRLAIAVLFWQRPADLVPIDRRPSLDTDAVTTWDAASPRLQEFMKLDRRRGVVSFTGRPVSAA